MALKKTPRGWIAEVRDRRKLTFNGAPVTDLFIQFSQPDRVSINYTGEDGVDIGLIYLPADPETIDDLAKGLKAAAKQIREVWANRSHPPDPTYRPPAAGGDINYNIE